MARKVSVILVDDLDGKELDSESAETVSFSLDGVAYEIDLSTQNGKKLRDALGKFVAAGRKVGKVSAAGRRSANGAARTNADRDDAKAARAWAVDKGLMKEDSRGRIPNAIMEQYRSANVG